MNTLNPFLRGSFVALVVFASAGWAFSQEAPVTPKQDRKIQAFDTITIDVFGEKDLSGDQAVQATGIIKYPLLGKVSVAGKTASEVADQLQAALEKDYLVNPQVTVTVKEYATRMINVTGEVTKPGAIQLRGEQVWTILDAIGAAGGFTKEAKEKIEFTRNGKTETYSFDELRKDPKKLKVLEPGDLINVPRRFF